MKVHGLSTAMEFLYESDALIALDTMRERRQGLS